MFFGRSHQFRTYLEAKWRDLYRVAYSWTHDRDVAADLVQETIARCLKHSARFNSKEELRPWLFKVMANCWRDQLRKHRVTMDIESADIQSDVNVEHQQHINGLVLQVNTAIRTLSPDQQEVLSLVAVEGLSYEEIADALEIPVGTVMSRISRARAKLRQALHQFDLSADKPFIRRVK